MQFSDLLLRQAKPLDPDPETDVKRRFSRVPPSLPEAVLPPIQEGEAVGISDTRLPVVVPAERKPSRGLA